ncbi:MAG: recombination mediator RecR [Candidatus Cloacimonetes bacterium]|nr:recombination mediator RecR [Candidatus Cloacimonadota bacterium]MCF7812853.1 recombination mediator RecR [Candidatus Cloacimonadota bacterium]MCF7867065.1 recombination mediator RecR [Candidatus Cloacimonadota bacterium]MCF7882615.1 recombination mediator RecR [Candidatus Cloacimonadota bacterium]
MFEGLLGELVQNLKRLPGIGNKSAQRLAMHIVAGDKIQALDLADSIQKAVENFTHCSVCNMLTETDPCRFCSDTSRQSDHLCVVENTQDIHLIENTHEFHGRYFVLGKLLSPLDGIGPNEINFPQLMQLMESENTEELILALNPSAEGESTISFIASHLEDKNVNITRLSTGLPFGGDLEYTSPITLGNALKRRYSVKD